MKEGPDISRIAALLGDPARANVLMSLMGGKALTVTELAQEAGVTLPTTSSHLAKLETGGLVRQRKQGRHRYYALAGDHVASVLEALLGLAASQGHLRTRTGPRDEAMRRARVCYNHLAGEAGIQMYDSLIDRDFLRIGAGGLTPTDAGRAFVVEFGIDIDALRQGRSPLCRECLDWSERRSHLAGRLGRAFFERMVQTGWARREPASRAVTFTAAGEAAFNTSFPRVRCEGASPEKTGHDIPIA
jgi:DNA-binding transcriptional ArsR family regulator